MKLLGLVFLARAVLPSLARESSAGAHINSGRSPELLPESGAVERRNAQVDLNPSVEDDSSGIPEGDVDVDSGRVSPRRLQLHFTDASKDERIMASDEAYAALLMDDHDRGIRTLGQSLIDSRTRADLVAILAPKVSEAAELRMRAQGWRIRRLAVDMPGEEAAALDTDSPSGSVLVHASAWALTEYKHVILMEDNMLVVENIDDLFECAGVCAAMEQAEVMSTSLIVLQPNLEMYRSMSLAVGTTYSFSNDFHGFLNSFFAGFEKCALFDLENPSLQDPSTDPNRGPDAPLLDHSCHRLPTRYNGDLKLIMLNGGLGMVRTKNAMPEEWWKQRRARVVRFGFAGLRPWMWFASPFLPFVSTWESAHFRAKPSDPLPNMPWLMFVWGSFMCAVLIMRALLVPMGPDGPGQPRIKVLPVTGANTGTGTRGWWPRWLAPSRRPRGGWASGYNPRGLLWSLVHLTVGYSSLTFAVVCGVRQVPTASTVWMSWIIFIIWTSTIFGLMWSLYLWVISRQAQGSSRPYAIGNGPLDLSANGIASAVGASVDLLKSSKIDMGVAGVGNVLKVGAVAPPSPWRESWRTLFLFAVVLAFLPTWKPLSGASTLPTLLGPVALALIAMFVGLTVQMVRLPVLWSDRCKFLSLAVRGGLYA